MKYIKKINLIDTNENKEIKNSYHKGTEYYEEVENQQHNDNKKN